MSLAPTATGVKSMPAKTGKPLDLSVRLAGNFPPQGVILVGVSGGGDSVGLLRLLAQMAPERGWRLVAAHVDHRLRSGSARDGRFVRDLAQKLGTGFDLRRVKVEAGGSSPEQAARSARYKALREMAKAHQALAIALGHTADDQAETLVARMFTGSGPTGMAGMRPNNGLLWRPLLGVRRQEVRDYLASLGQEWLSDPTNQELGPLRNRIRHKVLPLVEDMINPRTIEALGRLAGLSAEEEDHWQKWAQRVLQDRGSREGTSITLSNEWLKKAPLAERRRLLRYMAGVITQKGQHLLASHVDQLLDLAQGRSGRQLTLPGGIWAAKESQVLRMDQSSRPPDFRVFLQGPACVWLPHIGKVLMVDKVAEPKELQARGPAAWLPEGRVKWPLIVRPPLPGERFRPMGAPGSKLLSRVFIDLKVSLWWRRRTVVVADSRGAWWAGPWTVSERARKKVGESGWLGLRLIDT